MFDTHLPEHRWQGYGSSWGSVKSPCRIPFFGPSVLRVPWGRQVGQTMAPKWKEAGYLGQSQTSQTWCWWSLYQISKTYRTGTFPNACCSYFPPFAWKVVGHRKGDKKGTGMRKKILHCVRGLGLCCVECMCVPCIAYILLG